MTVELVEVSPRDGLQAESRTLPTETKLELITRLAEAGHTVIEATSFVNPKAVPQPDAEELLRGKPPSEELFAQAREIAAEDCSPSADGRGPADYKRHLAGELTRRTLRTSVERIRG